MAWQKKQKTILKPEVCVPRVEAHVVPLGQGNDFIVFGAFFICFA